MFAYSYAVTVLRGYDKVVAAIKEVDAAAGAARERPREAAGGRRRPRERWGAKFNPLRSEQRRGKSASGLYRKGGYAKGQKSINRKLETISQFSDLILSEMGSVF